MLLACEFGSQHASARKKLHAQKFSFRNFARCTTRRPRSHCTTTANSKHHSRLLVVTDARCSWKQQQSFATHWHSGCLWSVCPAFAVRERRAPTPQTESGPLGLSGRSYEYRLTNISSDRADRSAPLACNR